MREIDTLLDVQHLQWRLLHTIIIILTSKYEDRQFDEKTHGSGESCSMLLIVWRRTLERHERSGSAEANHDNQPIGLDRLVWRLSGDETGQHSTTPAHF
jgi:hypothetical protein